jgi:hypothetical protein
MRRTVVMLAVSAALGGCGLTTSGHPLKVTIDPDQPGKAMCRLAYSEVRAHNGVVPKTSVVAGQATLRIDDESGRTVYSNAVAAGEPNNGPSIPADPSVDLSPGHYTVVCQTDARSVSRSLTVTRN